jgi:DNA-binding LacI/PurR family transcriptional regulator
VLLAAPEPGRPAVVMPQEAMGELQVRHLAARGHRHLGYAAPTDPRVRSFRELRLAGARKACVELGLDPPHVVEFDLTLDGAVAAVKQWAKASVTGVVAYNDEFGVALLAGMRELGLTAPGDLAVIGVDNEPLSQFSYPPLTTVDLNLRTTAADLVDLVVNGITGQVPPAPRRDPISLVERASA